MSAEMRACVRGEMAGRQRSSMKAGHAQAGVNSFVMEAPPVVPGEIVIVMMMVVVKPAPAEEPATIAVGVHEGVWITDRVGRGSSARIRENLRLLRLSWSDDLLRALFQERDNVFLDALLAQSFDVLL